MLAGIAEQHSHIYIYIHIYMYINVTALCNCYIGERRCQTFTGAQGQSLATGKGSRAVLGEGEKAMAQGPGDHHLAKGIWSWVYGYMFRVQGLGFRVFGPGLYTNILMEASGQWLGIVLCLLLQV
jgi:hypothetical protein